MIKRLISVVLSLALTALSWGPQAVCAFAAERSVPGVKVNAPSLPSLPAIPTLPSVSLPVVSPNLAPVQSAQAPVVPAQSALVPQASAITPQAQAQTPFERSMERLSAPQTLTPEAINAAPAGEAKEAASSDFSARIGEEPAKTSAAVQVEDSSTGSRTSGQLSSRTSKKQRVERPLIERRSAFFPLALAGAAGAATVLFHEISSFFRPVLDQAGLVTQSGSVTHSTFAALALGAAVVGGVFAAATVLDAAVFLVAMKRGRNVTPAEFKRFVAAEVAAGRLDAGVAAILRPHRPQNNLRDLTFGYHQGGAIYLRPELAASPFLFRLVLVHELHHLRVGRERGPPGRGWLARAWRSATSELGARGHELRGPAALGSLKVPTIERALRQTQLSLQFDNPYEILVVNPSSEELKQPSLYRNLSGGSAKVETIVTPEPHDYLGQDKNKGRFKAVVVDRPADLLPAAGSPEAKKLDLALQQLDTLFILATRGTERADSGFSPNDAARYRSLVKQSRGVNRSVKREVAAFESKVKDMWRQIAGQRLQGLRAAAFVERLYSGVQDRGLAFLTFTPTDPGVAQWERLLRYWEAPDGGRLGTARVDLEDGGHILVVRKLEARVGLWLKPQRGGRIEKSVPDANGSDERRALAKTALEQAGFGAQLETFSKLGVIVEQVFGAEDDRQELYVTVPRRNAAQIRKYAVAESISIESSQADFQTHLLESGKLQHIDEMVEAGVDGTGGTIMVIDTGGDATHEDFAGQLEQLDMVHDGNEDWIGHGTHVLGIATSKNSRWTGMSKGAKAIIAKVFGRDNPGAADGPIMGAGSIARQRGVDVVNLSFGSRGSSADNLAMFFSDLASESLIVVASAGNSGPFDRTLSQPAAGENVISVAAAAKSLDDGRPEIAFYSSVGPDVDKRSGIARLRLKPDLTALGGDVTTEPDSPRTYKQGIGSAKSKDMPRRADDADDGRHTFMSGTSMASPMIAGIANLVKQALKKLGVTSDAVWSRLPFAVRAILMRSSTDLEVPIWYQGAGLVDAGAALRLIKDAVAGEGWGWLDRMKTVATLEDSAYKGAQLARTRALSRLEETAADSETPGEGREVVGNQVAVQMQKAFAEARAQAAPRLLELLDRAKEPVWLVRFQAALALLNMKAPETAIALADSALNDPDSRVRRMSLSALAELRGRSTDVLLQKAAEDPRWDVGAYAAYALARRGDRSAVDRIHKVLALPDKKARFTATWLLGQLGGRSAAVDAAALAGRLKDANERGNIRHLAAAALANVADWAPEAIGDSVVLDLLDNASVQNLALARTVSKFFPAALKNKAFADRIRAEPLRSSVTGFILRNKSQVGRPGALGEMVSLLARYLDLPLDFPTPMPDPSGPGVGGVDDALGRLDLIVEGPNLEWLKAQPLTRFEAELKASLPRSGAVWLSVAEHKTYALTLDLQRRGFTVRRAAALYPLAPASKTAGPGYVIDPASDVPGPLPQDADLSLVRVESAGGVSEARVLAALEKVADAAGDGLTKPVVVQLGLGAAAARRESTAPALTRLVDKLMLSNVGVVLAAGNEGPTERSLASPADAQLAVVVAAAGEKTGLQFYSSRGAPGRPGISWADTVEEVTPATLSTKLATELAQALGAGKGVGTGAAARSSAIKLSDLAKSARELAGPDGRLPDGWFFYLVAQVKRTLQAMPAGAAHEVGGGLFVDAAVAAATALLKTGAAPENREAAVREAGSMIAEARQRLAPPKPLPQAKRGAAQAFKSALKKIFRMDRRFSGLAAGAPTNGPPLAWWQDASKTRVAETVPLYALRREGKDPGVGKFADLGRYYREELSKEGVDAVLLLPHFATRGESPYAPVSLYALSEDQIDWSRVPEVAARPDLLDRLVATQRADRQRVDYAGVRARESAVMAEAFADFSKKGTDPEFEAFKSANASWLGEYAEFMALSDILGKPPLQWQDGDVWRARLDPRFAALSGARAYAQWRGYAQLRETVDEIHAAGGKVLFDIPMFRGKDSVDVWKRPGLFTDLATRNPGVRKAGVDEDWKDLALWNWTELGKDGYRAALAPYEHWLGFGFDGARVDAFHFAYRFDGQLASGDEPGDGYTAELAKVFKKRGAFPLAEAFEQRDQDARRLGFVTVYGDWKKVSAHDDPRPGDFVASVKSAAAEDRPGLAARFIGMTLGDEWGDPFRVKETRDDHTSVWRYRVPLPSDPDYANRVKADNRPRLAALKAYLSGDVWKAPESVGAGLSAAAARFVQDGPEGPEIWAASQDWFLEEWGRDAFVSLPGLLLSTGRADVARSVIRRFAKLERRGLIPNRIPRVGPPEYNTIDGSLWFVQAVKAYVEATGDRAFLQELRPTLMRVVDAYRSGTSYRRYGRDNKIFMDKDGLIVGPAQATWMDADPEGLDKPVTPRDGKAVEINALWYSSLKFLGLDELADKTRRSFNERFWFETPDNAAAWGGKGGALRDVVDGDPHGGAIRPNMLFAVSHGGDLLSPERRRAVVLAATRDLLTPFGPRTLSPRDSGYRARYDTALPPLEKDQAYHQGTAWPWLMGSYLDALARVRRDEGWTEERIAAERRELARPLAGFLASGKTGSLPEVFDGGAVLPSLASASLDDPRGLGPAMAAAAAASAQAPGGTGSQAWSVAELLRALKSARLIP